MSYTINPLNYRTSSVYDRAGRQIESINPLGEVSTTVYDAAGRSVAAVNPEAERTTTVYDVVGRQVAAINPLGEITTTLYDAAGEATVSIDALSRRTTTVYDAAGQSISNVNALNRRTTSVYDLAGQVIATYDAANRLHHSIEGADRTTYTYDANGNQRTVEIPAGDITTYTWNYENQLTGVEDPTGEVVTYTYAPVTKVSDELRYSKETDLGFTYYVWDSQNLILEIDDLGTTEAEYTAAPRAFGELVSQHRAAESTFYHFDPLGSTAALTDDTQAVSDSYVYGPFGQIVTSVGGTTNPYQWVGQLGYYHDESTGLYSLRKRDYTASEGRFLSQDPIGFEAGDDNLYRYVTNNPTNGTDPSGLQDENVEYSVYVPRCPPGVLWCKGGHWEQRSRPRLLPLTSDCDCSIPEGQEEYVVIPRRLHVGASMRIDAIVDEHVATVASLGLTENEHAALVKFHNEKNPPCGWRDYQASFQPGGANYELRVKQETEARRRLEAIYGSEQPYVSTPYYSAAGPMSQYQRDLIDRKILLQRQIDEKLAANRAKNGGKLALNEGEEYEISLLERELRGESYQSIVRTETAQSLALIAAAFVGIKTVPNPSVSVSLRGPLSGMRQSFPCKGPNTPVLRRVPTRLNPQWEARPSWIGNATTPGQAFNNLKKFMKETLKGASKEVKIKTFLDGIKAINKYVGPFTIKNTYLASGLMGGVKEFTVYEGGAGPEFTPIIVFGNNGKVYTGSREASIGTTPSGDVVFNSHRANVLVE